MDLELRELRRSADRVGWGMLLYTALLFAFGFVQAFVIVAAGWILPLLPDNGGVLAGIFEELSTGGIASIFSAAVSVGLLTLIFLKAAPMREVWQRSERKMTVLSFGKVFVLFMGFQLVFSFVSFLFELLLNVF